jgi:Zn-dependent alcohol dehydrogenase
MPCFVTCSDRLAKIARVKTKAALIGLPALGGHEGAGVVTKAGMGVIGIAECDHVILAFIRRVANARRA